MTSLIKALFAISDGLAWLLVFFAAICAVAIPIALPIYQRAKHGDTSVLSVASIALLCVLVAVGAYALARRRVFGLVLVLLPAIVEACLGRFAVGAALGIPMLVVFGTPFLLALAHAWAAASSRQRV